MFHIGEIRVTRTFTQSLPEIYAQCMERVVVAIVHQATRLVLHHRRDKGNEKKKEKKNETIDRETRRRSGNLVSAVKGTTAYAMRNVTRELRTLSY